MLFELIGFDIDSKIVCYRAYTTVKRNALLFNKIPKVVFPKMSHGIIFSTARVTSKQAPINNGDWINYTEYWLQKLKKRNG